MKLSDFIAPGSCNLKFHFTDEDNSSDYGKLWRIGEKAGRSLRAQNDHQPVAFVLTNTRACVTNLIGAIATGLPIVSIPLPPRGADFVWYRQFIQHACALSGVSTLLMDAGLASKIRTDGPEQPKIRVMSYEEALECANGHGPTEPGAFQLIQFTSGSTADPKGIVLSEQKIIANLQAILGWMEFREGDNLCSWLPLSHDMGLIGAFMATLAGAAGLKKGQFDFALMTPIQFMRRPSRWIEACEDFRVSLTVAPSYAYELVASSKYKGRDLRFLRGCVVGSEPVRPQALKKFAAAFADCGFNPVAFLPAYGMAEAVLAVTGVPLEKHWSDVPMETLVPRSEARMGYDDSKIVSCGRPLNGYEVRIDGDDIGEILVKGPSLSDSYVDGNPLPKTDGWLQTRDLGVLRDGELFVLGRLDDVFQVAGRNIYAVDVETYACEVDGVMAHRVVALSEDSALTLVAETRSRPDDVESSRKLALELKQKIVSRIGIAPKRILITARGSLPLTASGKVRRKVLLAALHEEKLQILPGSVG